ncbi:MAG: molybdopterin molybdotransferase MoeA [Planctomycetes bacterium]|nr:molybdopterin molybdotransferase MoeA [Planctomycetota bacterium]
MHEVSEADEILRTLQLDWSSEEVLLQDACGRILAENIVSDRPLPPCDCAAVKGIAIAREALGKQKKFLLQGVQPMGYPPISLMDAQGCLEIAKGAVLPDGCDMVIPQEEIDLLDGYYCLNDQFDGPQDKHVLFMGGDYEEGDILACQGQELTPALVGLCALVGCSELPVIAKVPVVLVGTGNSLVSVKESPKNYQLRRSNTYAAAAALVQQGIFEVEYRQLKFNSENAVAQMEALLEEKGIIILCGGHSHGLFDYLPAVLDHVQAKVLIHGINMKPDSSFVYAEKDGLPIFALPGNPVALMAGLCRFVIPHLWRCFGRTQESPKALALVKSVKPHSASVSFLAVKKQWGQEGVKADALAFDDPLSSRALAQCNGVVEIPPGEEERSSEEYYSYYSWDYSS